MLVDRLFLAYRSIYIEATARGCANRRQVSFGVRQPALRPALILFHSDLHLHHNARLEPKSGDALFAFLLLCKTELHSGSPRPGEYPPSASIRQQAAKRLVILAPYNCGAIVTRCHSRDGEGPSAHLSYRSTRHYSRFFKADGRTKARSVSHIQIGNTAPHRGKKKTGSYPLTALAKHRGCDRDDDRGPLSLRTERTVES